MFLFSAQTNMSQTELLMSDGETVSWQLDRKSQCESTWYPKPEQRVPILDEKTSKTYF